jgi:hypothetical protein
MLMCSCPSGDSLATSSSLASKPIAELSERRVHVDRVPQHDHVDDQPGRDDIEEVEHVVVSARLKRANVRQQRCNPSLIGEPFDCLRLRCPGKPGQAGDATFREPIQGRQTCYQLLHLLQSIDGAAEFGRTLQYRTIPQAIECAAPLAVRH